MKKHKKLNFYDRINIQAGLAKAESFSKIAKRLKCSPSTVSREVFKNSYYKEGNGFGKCKNLPKNHLCNGCSFHYTCTRTKKYYDFNVAQELSEEIKRKKGKFPKINLSKILEVDKIVREGVDLGQSLHHIYESNEKLKKICCERTLRRWICDGYLSVSPSELRNYVVYKREYALPKRGKDYNIEELAGRTMQDFREYVKENPELPIVQYDSVIGKKNDK